MNTQMPSPEGDLPWGGYGSLAAQVDALRRARLRVAETFEVTGRGRYVQGSIAEGEVSIGMVLLAQLEKWPNVVVSVPIRSVEGIRSDSNQDVVALGVGDVAQVTSGYAILLEPGTVIDVLEHAPAA